MTTADHLAEMTDYADLLLAVQPRVVTSREQAEHYLGVIDELTNRPMSDGQREIVGLLACLVHDWEEEHEEPVTATQQEMVELFLEDRGLRQRDLVPDVFPTESGVSDFMRGRRRLTYDRVQRLASFFGVSPAMFYERPGASSRNTQ